MSPICSGSTHTASDRHLWSVWSWLRWSMLAWLTAHPQQTRARWLWWFFKTAGCSWLYWRHELQQPGSCPVRPFLSPYLHPSVSLCTLKITWWKHWWVGCMLETHWLHLILRVHVCTWMKSSGLWRSPLTWCRTSQLITCDSWGPSVLHPLLPELQSHVLWQLDALPGFEDSWTFNKPPDHPGFRRDLQLTQFFAVKV